MFCVLGIVPYTYKVYVTDAMAMTFVENVNYLGEIYCVLVYKVQVWCVSCTPICCKQLSLSTKVFWGEICLQYNCYLNILATCYFKTLMKYMLQQ